MNSKDSDTPKLVDIPLSVPGASPQFANLVVHVGTFTKHDSPSYADTLNASADTLANPSTGLKDTLAQSVAPVAGFRGNDLDVAHVKTPIGNVAVGFINPKEELGGNINYTSISTLANNTMHGAFNDTVSSVATLDRHKMGLKIS